VLILSLPSPRAATIIPTIAVIVLVLLVLFAVMFYIAKRNGRRQDDWEIKYDELDVTDLLGTGAVRESLPRGGLRCVAS
jgi:uncharacterized membrane protein YsdA (DUF1294 family)